MNEFEGKQEQIHRLLDKYQLDCLQLNRVSSFAWATCGAPSYVSTAASDGVATLLITKDHRYLVTNNIEAPRLEKEEGLAAQGWEFVIQPWYEPSQAIQQLTQGLKIGADSQAPGALDLSVELARLRSLLTLEEGERFRTLGKLCAQAMDAVMKSIQPGQSERQIAARLAEQTEIRGVQPIAMMVASDERIFSYRHPIPKDKELVHYAMVILCGRRWGLVCSLTRCIHFGKMPDELQSKMHAVARIDSTFINHTRPGRKLGEIFNEAQKAYAQAGYPEEWKMHHQGGSAGYEPREFVAVPDMDEPVRLGQSFAWNPSIRGAKSEDTILVTLEDNEVLTAIEGWPLLSVNVNGRKFLRPAIREVI